MLISVFFINFFFEFSFRSFFSLLLMSLFVSFVKSSSMSAYMSIEYVFFKKKELIKIACWQYIISFFSKSHLCSFLSLSLSFQVTVSSFLLCDRTFSNLSNYIALKVDKWEWRLTTWLISRQKTNDDWFWRIDFSVFQIRSDMSDLILIELWRLIWRNNC